jgi:hypothetical protein
VAFHSVAKTWANKRDGTPVLYTIAPTNNMVASECDDACAWNGPQYNGTAEDVHYAIEWDNVSQPAKQGSSCRLPLPARRGSAGGSWPLGAHRPATAALSPQPSAPATFQDRGPRTPKPPQFKDWIADIKSIYQKDLWEDAHLDKFRCMGPGYIW